MSNNSGRRRYLWMEIQENILEEMTFARSLNGWCLK